MGDSRRRDRPGCQTIAGHLARPPRPGRRGQGSSAHGALGVARARSYEMLIREAAGQAFSDDEARQMGTRLGVQIAAEIRTQEEENRQRDGARRAELEATFLRLSHDLDERVAALCNALYVSLRGALR